MCLLNFSDVMTKFYGDCGIRKQQITSNCTEINKRTGEKESSVNIVIKIDLR